MAENNNKTYEELFRENAALREEVSALKRKLNPDILDGMHAQPEPVVPSVEEMPLESPPHTRIHKRSSPDEKIKLFMELFAGRTDVYARRYESRRTGKSGYTPVCGNEWVRGICEKPKVKCSKCQNRDLLPLTRTVIERHLRGKDPRGEDVIGVYPMLPDETCRFLVADFDGEKWQEDVRIFRDVCRRHGLSVYVERSRSGNGGHVWLFFRGADTLSAGTAAGQRVADCCDGRTP